MAGPMTEYNEIREAADRLLDALSEFDLLIYPDVTKSPKSWNRSYATIATIAERYARGDFYMQYNPATEDPTRPHTVEALAISSNEGSALHRYRAGDSNDPVTVEDGGASTV